jgi:hypothetical protein
MSQRLPSTWLFDSLKYHTTTLKRRVKRAEGGNQRDGLWGELSVPHFKLDARFESVRTFSPVHEAPRRAFRPESWTMDPSVRMSKQINCRHGQCLPERPGLAAVFLNPVADGPPNVVTY